MIVRIIYIYVHLHTCYSDIFLGFITDCEDGAVVDGGAKLVPTDGVFGGRFFGGDVFLGNVWNHPLLELLDTGGSNNACAMSLARLFLSTAGVLELYNVSNCVNMMTSSPLCTVFVLSPSAS